MPRGMNLVIICGLAICGARLFLRAGIGCRRCKRCRRRRESRLAEVESLALGERRIDDLSEEELMERLRYLRPERIMEMDRRARREEKGE